jgi:hypothetical protein
MTRRKSKNLKLADEEMQENKTVIADEERQENKTVITDEEKQKGETIRPNAATKEDYIALMQEIFNLMNVHGPIVGVIIQINRSMLQETAIFFSDGFTTCSELPLIGYDIETETEYRYNLLAAKELIGSIYKLGLKIEGDYICRRGTPKELEQPQYYNKTCYFVFRPPEDGIVNFSECLGIWMLDEQVRIIAEDESSELMPEVGAEDF